MAITFNGRAVKLTIRESKGKLYRPNEVIGFRYMDETTDEHFEKACEFRGSNFSEFSKTIHFLPGMDEANCIED